MPYYTLRSDKRKSPMPLLFEHYNADDVRALCARETVQALDLNSRVVNIRITSVKKWKTRPDVRVRYQYGLYEHGEWDLETAMCRLVRQVEQPAPILDKLG